MAAALAMTAPHAISFRKPVLPWSTAADDEKRFRSIAGRVLALVLLLGLLVPWLPLPKIERTEVQPLPPPIAKLLLERQATPPAPPPRRRRRPRPCPRHGSPSKASRPAKWRWITRASAPVAWAC